MRIKSVLATLALSPLAVSVVHADQLSDVMSKKSLSCGVYADVPPFSAPDPETRELVGMDVDLCKAPPNTWAWSWNSSRCRSKHVSRKSRWAVWT